MPAKRRRKASFEEQPCTGLFWLRPPIGARTDDERSMSSDTRPGVTPIEQRHPEIPPVVDATFAVALVSR